MKVKMTLVIAIVVLLVVSAVESQQKLSAEHRIETTTPMVFSNLNVNLNNVGLEDEEPEDLGPKLEGPNVCTKQEP